VAGIVATVVLIAASILMNTALGPKIVIPGPLTTQHAMLTEDCAHCHSAEMDSFKGVLHGVFNSELSLYDSGRCLKCHNIGANAMQAHAMSVVSLKKGAGPLGGIHPPISTAGEVACMVCHVEHEGRLHDLTAMTEAQCQSCHSARFDSFHQGHPEFDGFPYNRRLRIAFDHASHINEYFPTKNPDEAPVACTACHAIDSTGDFMTSLPFEQACAACHANDVDASTRTAGAGIKFLTLPAIDTMTLEDAGIGIGAWPADAAIAEGEITPFTHVLLAADQGLRNDLEEIDTLDLLDLQDATDEQLAAVARVAWAIKALAQEIAEDGHAALLRRVGNSIGDGQSLALSSHLAGGLSRTMWRSSLDAWLPGLADELAKHAAGDDPATDPLEDAIFDETRSPGESWSSQGGWYRDDMAFALRYRPTGHADEFLRAWAELATSDPVQGRRVLDAFRESDATGKCFQCHSIDEVHDDSGARSLRINWYARRPDDVQGGLTRFRHAPH